MNIIRRELMTLEIEKIKNRKFFRENIWSRYELSQLDNMLKEFGFHNNMIPNILLFKLNRLKNWKTRYRRLISKGTRIINKYTRLLRYGKENALIWHEEQLKNFKYFSSKEYLILKYGREEGEQKHLNKSSAFRNSDIQRQNSLKCAKKKKDNPELYKDITSNQIGYWLKQGYSEEESKRMVSERQKTFSLEICIKKHGESDGKRIFDERQRKWLETLDCKSQEEMDDINRRKNPCLKREGESKEEFRERVGCIGAILFDNDELILHIENSLQNIKWKYLTKFEFIKKLPFIGNCDLNIVEYLNSTGFNFPEKNLVRRNKRGNTYLNIQEGVLRSFFEIEFYEGLRYRNIKFKLDREYPNSKLKYDFYLYEYDIYIEIAGSMYDDTYAESMYCKNTMFGAYIIEPNEIQDFLKRIDDGEFTKINSNV